MPRGAAAGRNSTRMPSEEQVYVVGRTRRGENFEAGEAAPAAQEIIAGGAPPRQTLFKGGRRTDAGGLCGGQTPRRVPRRSGLPFRAALGPAGRARGVGDRKSVV